MLPIESMGKPTLKVVCVPLPMKLLDCATTSVPPVPHWLLRYVGLTLSIIGAGLSTISQLVAPCGVSTHSAGVAWCCWKVILLLMTFHQKFVADAVKPHCLIRSSQICDDLIKQCRSEEHTSELQ